MVIFFLGYLLWLKMCQKKLNQCNICNHFSIGLIIESFHQIPLTWPALLSARLQYMKLGVPEIAFFW